jgi:hypothetical protein
VLTSARIAGTSSDTRCGTSCGTMAAARVCGHKLESGLVVLVLVTVALSPKATTP